MKLFGHSARIARPGWLTRLARDTRANTLAIMAIALIPISALAGSAVDTARMYVVKARLQQACDAGALAGRRFMTASNATTLDDTATAQANAFFKSNFRFDSSTKIGWMQTSNVSFTPSKTTNQQVAGTASATVPMTLMKMFGSPDVTLNVTCEARFDVADADVMFVLDTTGSMACLTSDDINTCNSYAANTGNQSTSGTARWVNEKTSGGTKVSRIQGLRDAVLSFYDALTTGIDPTTNIRFGFVPYATTVNVGKIIPSSYMATSATYQSRELRPASMGGPDSNVGSATSSSTSNVAQSSCATGTTRAPAAAATYDSNNQAVVTTTTWTKNSGNALGTCTASKQTVAATWYYHPMTLDTSQFITGNSVTLSTTTLNGASDSWEGCIEERGTTASTSFSQSSLPNDLNPDLTPSASDPTTQWKPMWFDVQYDRNNTTSETSASTTRLPSDRYLNNTFYPATTLAYAYNALACPKQAQRLKTMTRTDVSNYVNAADFRPYGLTYHDIGMIWALRFLAPAGPFAADTAAWPGHNAPNRYIIFLTDGDMENQNFAYDAYGMERLDKRVTTDGSTNLVNNHNARFLAECTAAKDPKRGITVFTVAYAQVKTPALTSCATPGRDYYAKDTAALTSAFQDIAKQIAMLRVSK